MRSADEIIRLIKKINAQPGAEMDQKTLNNMIVAQESVSKTAPIHIGRIIMKSKLTKLAAAAVIILAGICGMWFFVEGGTSVALADVLQKVEQVQAFMYKIKMKGNIQTGTQGGPMEMTGNVLMSNEYGMKMEMDMNTVINGVGHPMIQQMYMLPQQKKVYMIMPAQKQYMQMEYSDDLIAKMKQQSNDPRDTLKKIVNSKYTEIGKSIINGVEVEGFKTTDPAFAGGITEDVNVILWIDRKTELPVREEMHLKMNEQMQMDIVLEDFTWNMQVSASEFEPVIPQDYTTIFPGGYKLPAATEEGAIEGLRFCKDLLGRFPKKIDIMNLMQDVMSIKDSNNPTPAALKLKAEIDQLKKEEPNGQMDKQAAEEKGKEFAAKIMDIMRPVQSLAIFQMTLVQEKKDPVYYGDKVTVDDPNAVLMRWKISDTEYRVIFGNLTAETVTAEEMAELEKCIAK